MQLILTHASIVKLDRTWSCPPDLVKDFRLILVQSGNGLWTIDRRTYLLRSNALIFLRPGQLRHARMVPRQPIQYLAVRFSVSEMPAVLPQWLMLPTVMQLNPTVRSEIESIVTRLQEEHERKDFHHHEMIDAQARQLFVLLARSQRQGIDLPVPSPSPEWMKHMHQIEAAIHYIHDHLGDQFAMSDLAEIAGMSESHFRRVFRTLTGMSPHRYVIKARMWRARELLSEGCFYVYEVAKAVGYDDNLYFSRLFHRFVGVPPTEYGSTHRVARGGAKGLQHAGAE